MATTGTFEGFSVTHAQILDGTTAYDSTQNQAFGDIYGVSNASLSPSTGNFDNTGDDQVLSTWYWFDYATLTAEAGYISFSTIASLTGVSYTSSGTGPNDYHFLPLWQANSMNIASKPVLIRTESRDVAGAVRTLDFVLYKVQFSPITFNGPQYHQGLRVNYNGRCLMSNVDETGATLAQRAVGRLVNRPLATVNNP